MEESWELFCFVSSSNLTTSRSTQFLPGALCNRRAIRVQHLVPRAPRPPNKTLACIILEPPPPAETMPTVEEEITLTSQDGCQLGAYFVHPEDVSEVDGRGVILLTDILGYKNEDTRSVAKRFAEGGLPTGKDFYPHIPKACKPI